jgi:hypothetical protein
MREVGRFTSIRNYGLRITNTLSIRKCGNQQKRQREQRVDSQSAPREAGSLPTGRQAHYPCSMGISEKGKANENRNRD